MKQRRGGVVTLLAPLRLLPALMGACSARELENPVRLTLTNHSERTVTGALLRFDRDLSRVDRVSSGGFSTLKLRLAPANALRLEGGSLRPGERAVYELEGDGGPPRPLDGRWLVHGRLGARMMKDEFDVR